MTTHAPVEPALHPVAIADLRPTQMTVGKREVRAKRAEWRARAAKDGADFLGRHMIPAIAGPDGRWWLIDHHHLALALFEEGVEHALVSPIAHLRHLREDRFLAFLDSHNWLHPYDEHGCRRPFTDLPDHVRDLTDDPYRSLAGEARAAGGFAKSQTPYAEFLWADFFRDRIARHHLEDDFDKTLAHAIALARAQDAAYLPGFSGPD